MLVVARSALLPILATASVADKRLAADAFAVCGECLLLEGSWPTDLSASLRSFMGARRLLSNRHSLDDAIDARCAWIDDEAQRLASLCGEVRSAADEPPPGWLHALKLRYYLVKLLRLSAWFEMRFAGLAPPTDITVVLEARDDDYRQVLESLAELHGFRLHVRCIDIPPKTSDSTLRGVGAVGRGASLPALARRRISGALAWLHRLAPPRSPSASTPQLVFCGNRFVLGDVCQAALRRSLAATWLYETFSPGAWLAWRGQGVDQWTCDEVQGESSPAPPTPDNGVVAPQTPTALELDSAARLPTLTSRGIDVTRPAAAFLEHCERSQGARWRRVRRAIERHFARHRPAALIVDEDATPLARLAILAARRQGAPSFVLQHGVPRVQFGFAPPAADHLLVWGETSRDQLAGWGVATDRIHLVGSPRHDRLARRLVAIRPSKPRPPATEDRPRIVFFATTPPDDARPDAVAFRLTSATHQTLLRRSFQAVADVAPRAEVIVKLHPRCRDASPFRRVVDEFPELRIRLQRSGNLPQLLRGAACVLNCTSSAGIDAALSGVPVIELIPDGSLDLLPAAAWGARGTPRSLAELQSQLLAALNEPEDPLADQRRTVAMSRVFAHCPLTAEAGRNRSNLAAQAAVDTVMHEVLANSRTAWSAAGRRAPAPAGVGRFQAETSCCASRPDSTGCAALHEASRTNPLSCSSAGASGGEP